MRGRKRLEGRVAAFPVRAQTCIDAREIAMGVRILHVAREQAPAALEYLRGTGDAGARQHRGGDPALRRPAGVEKFRLRPIDPAFEQARGEAAGDSRRARHGFRIQTQKFRGQIRRSEGREQAGGMEPALVQLAGGYAAHAAGDLVAQGDGRDQVASGHRRELGERQRRGHGRAAHVDDRLIVRIVVLQGLRKRAVGERGRRHTDAVSETEDAARTRGRHGDDRVARRFSERSFRAGERQPDHVHHAQLGGFDDIGGQIFESEARRPGGEVARKWNGHGTTVQ